MISNISSCSNSLKSEISLLGKAKEHYSPDSTPETQDSSFISEFIPTVFEWKGEGHSVFITGSFCNWKQKFKMIQLESSFQLIIVKIKLIIFRTFPKESTNTNSSLITSGSTRYTMLLFLKMEL